MKDKENKTWLSSLVSMVAIFTVILNAMGFLTVRTFIVRMCLSTNFFEDTPVDYFQWGAKAVVALIVIIISTAIYISLLIAILSFITRLTILRFKSIKKVSETAVKKIQAKFRIMSASRRIAVLFGLSIIAFIVYFGTQSAIIGEFTREGCKAGRFVEPIVFSSSNSQALQIYRTFSAFLIIILSVALFLSNRTLIGLKTKKILPNLFTFAVFSLWLIALAFWSMPYRLMSHNEFEEVRYGNEKAFVISEKGSQLFLYTPGTQPFVIDKSDSLLDMFGKHYYKNIFDN